MNGLAQVPTLFIRSSFHKRKQGIHHKTSSHAGFYEKIPAAGFDYFITVSVATFNRLLRKKAGIKKGRAFMNTPFSFNVLRRVSKYKNQLCGTLGVRYPKCGTPLHFILLFRECRRGLLPKSINTLAEYSFKNLQYEWSTQ